MIESSLLTFESFCIHHDGSSLFADHAYLHQYESVLRLYAQLASTRNVPTKGTASRPIQMRWRNAGLGAIKCISASDALSSVSGRQIDVIVPMVLENLWTEDEVFLDSLLQRVEVEEKVDTEKLLRRRMSTATVRTGDTGGDPNPLVLSGTALDVDKMAEEDTGVLALQCLKSIFVVPNRSQIHAATTALLKFISERVAQGTRVIAYPNSKHGSGDGWALKMYNVVARWTPVQDRYAILVAALDALTATPMREDTLNQHMALTSMIESLLRSDINLIGLSVMDVLQGLIKQIRKLFQLSNQGSRAESPNDEKTDTEKENESHTQRRELLARLEQCIGNLASHVYYADQITDMINAILARLKPGRSASAISTPQGEKADGNDTSVVGPASSTMDLTESQLSSMDAYFSYNLGRVSALRVVKTILHVANPKTKTTSNMDLSRNRVPMLVWERTQWLLRDPDGHVRKAYVEALMTWLDYETTHVDSNAKDDVTDRHRSPLKHNHESQPARRAVSNASNRERQPRGRRSQFLPLLHLAIYDNALSFVEYDSDIALLHNLSVKLVFKLGVNSVRYGIPMIYRLQEEVQELELPIHKVRVAALCHGYFWALSEKFEFESSAIGRAISNEIIRRRSKGFWVDGIHVPAPSTDQIGMPGQIRPQPAWDLSALMTEELLPFDDRSSLIQCIAVGYEESTLSPPTSPAVSPGRTFSGPILGPSINSTLAADKSLEFPSSYRDQMAMEWSRDEVVTALAAEGKSESLNGSRTGTTGTNLNRLTITTAGLNGNGYYMSASPYGSQHNLRPHSSQALGDRDRLGSASRLRQTSIRSAVSPSLSMSSKIGVASVEQLKQVLSGNVSPKTTGAGNMDDDSGSSMVSYYSPSETSFSPHSTQPPQLERTNTGSDSARRLSLKGPLTSNPPNEAVPNLYEEEEQGDYIPPVPPLPNLSTYSDKGSMHAGEISVQDHAYKTARRTLSSRAGESVAARSLKSYDDGGHRGVDLHELLRGIDSRPGEGSLAIHSKPPY